MPKQNSYFVFISHASVDKPRIKPVLEFLIARGVPLWVDRPYDIGLSEDNVAGCIDRSVSGDATTAKQQIDSGLRRAYGMLIFPSEAAKRSEQVNVEIGFALAECTRTAEEYGITPFFLDEAAFSFAEWRTADIQGYSTFVEAEPNGVWRLTRKGVEEADRAADAILAHLTNMKKERRDRRSHIAVDRSGILAFTRDNRILATLLVFGAVMTLTGYGLEYSPLDGEALAFDAIVAAALLLCLALLAAPIFLVQLLGKGTMAWPFDYIILTGATLNTVVLLLLAGNFIRWSLRGFRRR